MRKRVRRLRRRNLSKSRRKWRWRDRMRLRGLNRLLRSTRVGLGLKMSLRRVKKGRSR